MNETPLRTVLEHQRASSTDPLDRPDTGRCVRRDSVVTPNFPPRRVPIDMDYVQTVLLQLLATPSPVGRTDAVVQFIGERLLGLGVDLTITRRGLLNATLQGDRPGPDRAIVVHADTIGCMVTRLKENGRLQITQLGTHSARFAEGATVTIFTDDPRVTYTGTVLPLKSSGHQYGDEVDSQGVGWPLVEVRVDERVFNAEGLAALGMAVGTSSLSTPTRRSPATDS